jgi:hypothetical protein
MVYYRTARTGIGCLRRLQFVLSHPQDLFLHGLLAFKVLHLPLLLPL